MKNSYNLILVIIISKLYQFLYMNVREESESEKSEESEESESEESEESESEREESKSKSKSKSESKREKIKTRKNINIINSISENYLSCIFILICIYLVSSTNIVISIFTFFFMFFSAYFLHFLSHKYQYMPTILHQYHHKNNNFFSHFIEVLLELTFPIIFLPVYYYFGKIFLDVWVILLGIVFYSSVHNINYGYFRVNNVHSIHHKEMFTNLGPDFCDIMFGTKNYKDTSVENTNHYIPNVIIITFIILLLKYCCSNTFFKKFLLKTTIMLLISSFIFLLASTLYVYCFIKV